MSNIDESLLMDFDPDINYYNNLCNENQLFNTFNSFEDFNVFNREYMDDDHLTVLCQNIRSMNRNLDNLLSLFDENLLPDVIVLTETWHDSNTPVVVPGFSLYHTVRPGP